MSLFLYLYEAKAFIIEFIFNQLMQKIKVKKALR